MPATFSIGSFTFISLTRPADKQREQIAHVSRAGVDGVAAFKTGKRTEPFTIESVVDVSSLDAAITRIREYEDAVGTTGRVTWNSVDSPHTYVILDVKPGPPQPIKTPVGGLVTGQAVVRCQWTLLAIV